MSLKRKHFIVFYMDPRDSSLNMSMEVIKDKGKNRTKCNYLEFCISQISCQHFRIKSSTRNEESF